MGLKRRRNFPSKGGNEKLAKSNSCEDVNKRTVIQRTNEQQALDGKECQTSSSIGNKCAPEIPNTTFVDVGGCEAQFLETIYLLMHLKHPEMCAGLGVSPPKGLLLHGPPGCGKSLFVRAISGELKIPLLYVSSTEFIAGISGDSERRIRNIFSDAAAVATPILLLIEDIDVIAGKRENAQREMERRIVAQLIASMDELGKNDTFVGSRVFVIGTTNRPEIIDASLRRAGRFDKEIAIGIPDKRTRLEILRIASRNISLAKDVDLERLARLTPGYVGADLFALTLEACNRAISRALITLTSGENVENLEEKRRDEKCDVPRKRTLGEIRSELAQACAWLRGPTKTATDYSQMATITMENFEWALSTVHPSAKREGFSTIPDVTWDDIGSLEEVRSELNWSILYPIQRPEYFEQFGLQARPQGVLFCGPPGCGKTMLAKAVANETGMSFISVKGPELMSMYVGESERAVRTLFQRARDSAPSVIFFDEIDSLCPKRSQKESGSARLVNQLLTEMDGLDARKDVFLIGATNRPDIIDPAIMRPGRFDKVIFVGFPSAADRAQILRACTKNKTSPRISASVSFEQLAEELEFFTGADLVALIREATLIALKQRRTKEQKNQLELDAVAEEHFHEAIKKILPSVKPEDRHYYQTLKGKFARKD